MKMKLFMLIIAILFAAFSFASLASAQMSVTPTNITYHRFLVADLGLIGVGGKNNEIFRVTFSSGGPGNYYLTIDVKDSTGVSLLSGQTDRKDYDAYLEGKTFTNFNIADASNLGGSFKIKTTTGDMIDKVLATGALPEGNFTITLKLVNADKSLTEDTDIVNVQITPPYLQPIYPVNISTTRSAMNFRWRSDIDNMELHMFLEPSGKSEITSGGRLPQLGLGGGLGGATMSLDGSSIASLLSDGSTYFWQVYGTINTSHGNERVKGPLSEFLYFEESSQVILLGFSDTQKAEVMGELLDILEEIVNKRAAKAIQEYDIERIILDNGLITFEEVMAILKLIKEKQVTVNSVYFR